jgi:hypothetical protein
MARIQVLKAHGTIQRYRQGCRCDECRRANTDYATSHKLGTNLVAGDNVTSIKRRQAKTPRKHVDSNGNVGAVGGEVERAVKSQLADFTSEFPTQVEMALVAARILDNDDRVALHPTTLRQLGAIVEGLTAGKKKKSRGRLAAVQDMTKRRSANA